MRVKQDRFSTVLVLIILMIVPWACQSPEDEIPLETAATAGRMVVKLEQVPRLSEYLQEGLGLNEDAQLFSVNQGGNRLPLEIDWEQIYQLVDAQGKETYTFRITDHDGDIATFYNLVLKVSENGEPQPPFLMKYTMAEDFVATYLATGSLEGFTGTRQRIYLTAAGTANNGGSRAWLDNTLVGSGIIANPCPEQNLGGGSSSGDTGQGSICRTYEVTTLWYSQTVGHPPVLVDVTVTYRTECGPGESTAAGVSRDCRPEDEEIPILDPLLDLSNPCKLKKLIEENPEIVDKLLQLKQSTSLSKEVGYVMTKNSDGSFDFRYIQGEENRHELDFNHNGNLSGLMHTHFNGGLSVPSDFDIKSLYTTLDYMDNPKTYLFGVVTWHQTVYLITINSSSDFRTFGDRYLADDSPWFSFFSEKFRLNISNDNSVQDNETNFVKLLTEFNTGLSLVRGDVSTMNSWTKLIQKRDGSIQEKQCR